MPWERSGSGRPLENDGIICHLAAKCLLLAGFKHSAQHLEEAGAGGDACVDVNMTGDEGGDSNGRRTGGEVLRRQRLCKAFEAANKTSSNEVRDSSAIFAQWEWR